MIQLATTQSYFRREKKRQNNTFDLVATVHEAEQGQSNPIEPEHRFEVTLEPDEFTEEKFALFADYQVHVHHDEPSKLTSHGFKQFLCSSPLQRRNNGKKLGSFHQCYRIDGRLIAMGVLDLLPHAVSGVYFVYHQDFEKWSFGKLSALREAALALECGYEYYYMGYYIHECVKMRYKGDYKPQYVLDQESHKWDTLEGEMRDLLNKRKYVSLSAEKRRNTRATPASETADAHLTSPREDAEEVKHPLPLAAMRSRLSLLTLGMPGVLSLPDLGTQVDLDRMKIYLRMVGVHQMRDLASWDEGSELEPDTLKGVIAELAACIGPALAQEIVVDFMS